LLTRYYSPKEQKEISKKLETGEIDVVIGTHRLLSKDVSFKDLGLLVIDEEQRFGVAQKERLKQMKKAVDVLSMSATPIPRTLHMSLVGIRDISIIETPPKDRLAIQTAVVPFNDDFVREAIEFECGRSDRLAFCYLLVPSDKILTSDARKRLGAIQEFADLGAGFRIAAKDLEIRGAGNILGGEQSGQIAAVGLEMYTKLLEEAIRELKGEAIEEEVETSMNLGVDIY